jgi:predicted metal-dependent hydrolase
MTDLPVRVIRSPRRKKTISAGVVGGELVVRVPARISKREEREWIAKMKEKLAMKSKRSPRSDDELKVKADVLNNKYFRGKLKINSIIFSDRQRKRHGSCNTLTGDIRISRKLLSMPGWVLDYVIVHELAHLVFPDHSKGFWDLVIQYRYAERARGFLIARDLEDDEIVT